MFYNRRSSLADINLNKHKGGDGEGLDFGRRMSLSSSVGGRKYGRASDHGPGPRQVPVRHIPIVIEASDNDDSDFSDVTGGGQASGHTRLVTRGPVTVPINYSWSIVYTDSDRSSLSSGSSGDNSVETMRGHNQTVNQPLRPSRGNFGLQERKYNVDSQANMRSVKNFDNKKLYGGVEEWRQSLKTNSNKLEGKENELVRNKEAVKNRSTQALEDSRKTEGRKATNSTRQQIVKTAAGSKNCPVHGTGDTVQERKKTGKLEYLSKQLKSPSLLSKTLTKKSDDKMVNNETGHKNHIVKDKPNRESLSETLVRRPERWSIKRHKSTSTINNTNGDNEQQQQQQQPFHRRWSFRLPGSGSSGGGGGGSISSDKQNIQSSATGKQNVQQVQQHSNQNMDIASSSNVTSAMPSIAPSASSLTNLWSGPLKIPDYFRVSDRDRDILDHHDGDDDDMEPADVGPTVGKLKRFVSHTDLSRMSSKPNNGSLNNFLKTPSSSTSSIPAKVNSEKLRDGKPPQYVGILKTPGRRKLSSNNRVEFLDNLQEKEIPGRYA